MDYACKKKNGRAPTTNASNPSPRAQTNYLCPIRTKIESGPDLAFYTSHPISQDSCPILLKMQILNSVPQPTRNFARQSTARELQRTNP